MIALIIVQAANKLAHFGKEVVATWQEAQRLRQALSGPTEEKLHLAIASRLGGGFSSAVNQLEPARTSYALDAAAR